LSQQSILLITYHFYPSIEIGARRVTALARYLTDAGFKVVVVSEFGSHKYTPESEIWPGVLAIPIAQPRRLLMDTLVALKQRTTLRTDTGLRPSHATHNQPTAPLDQPPTLLARLRNWFFKTVYFVDVYKRWSWNASQAAIRAGKKYEAQLVLSSGPPHSVLIAGTRAARKLGIPHIADLRDPWADLVTAVKPRAYTNYGMLRALEGWVMRSSAAITSTGATVAQLLSSHHAGTGQKMHVVRNGFDGEVNPSTAETGGRLAILFAGELYAGRDPFPLFLALEKLLADSQVDASRITFTFMGRCATYAGLSLADWLRGKRCEAVVKILGQMPSAAVAQAAKEATVLLNLAQQQPLSVPAKTFEHLASGREILLVCENDSETAQVVAGIPGVMQVDQADPKALEAALMDLYQRHVVEGKLTAPDKAHVLPFSRNAVNEKFLSVMRSVARLN